MGFTLTFEKTGCDYCNTITNYKLKMPEYQSQDFLFQRIKELIPSHQSLVDELASILHISSDSAYRRIRGSTPLVLDEARILCQHYKLSLDQILNAQSGTTLFKNVRVSDSDYNYEKYLTDLLRQAEQINNFIKKEVIYLSKDLPLFHNFYFKPLIAFRHFFWMKTMIRHPDYQDRQFEIENVPPEIEKVSLDLAMAYNKIPSTEIWNTESINSIILQIEFYKDSGVFSSENDIRTVYESLQQTIEHLRTEAEYGAKFMPGENPESKKENYRFFFNRVLLGDNTIITVTDNTKTVFINYDVLNYMYTRDEIFCSSIYNDMQYLMKKSTLISQTSEKQRNIFFGIMMNKVKDRINHI